MFRRSQVREINMFCIILDLCILLFYCFETLIFMIKILFKIKKNFSILISDKIDFKTKAVTRDKEGHYLKLKGVVLQKDITFVNIYAPSKGSLYNTKGWDPLLSTFCRLKCFSTSVLRELSQLRKL